MAMRKKPVDMGKATMVSATRAPVRTARPVKVKRAAAVVKPVARRMGASAAAAPIRRAAAAGGATPNVRVRAMAQANPTIAPGETNPNGPGPKTPPEDRYKPTAAAIKRVRQNAKKNGKTLTNEEAVKRATRQTRIDKEGGGAARFDFAGDGAYTKDKDFGSKRNNQRRAATGKDRANVKKADRYGTGKRFTDKQKEDAKKNYSVGKKKDDKGNDNGNGNGNGDGNGNGNDNGSGDPFPNGNQDGNPNGQSPATDLSPRDAAARGAGPAGSPGRTAYEKEQERLARRRRNRGRNK